MPSCLFHPTPSPFFQNRLLTRVYGVLPYRVLACVCPSTTHQPTPSSPLFRFGNVKKRQPSTPLNKMRKVGWQAPPLFLLNLLHVPHSSGETAASAASAAAALVAAAAALVAACCRRRSYRIWRGEKAFTESPLAEITMLN